MFCSYSFPFKVNGGRFLSLLVPFRNIATCRHSKQNRSSMKQEFSGEALSKQNVKDWLTMLSCSSSQVLNEYSVVHHICIPCIVSYSGLSISFESLVALFSTPIANLLLCGWILLTTDNFTRTIKGNQTYSAVLNRRYRLRPLMTALVIDSTHLLTEHCILVYRHII